MTSGASAPYHVSPMTLDAVIHSGITTKRWPIKEKQKTSDILACAYTGINSWSRDAGQTNPMHRYVGVDISCPAADADSVSVTSHRLWTKARLSERCSARIQGLVAKSLPPQRATRLQASSARPDRLVRARESSLSTVYACQWQARGGGVVPVVDRKLRLRDVACEQTRLAGKASRRLPRPWTLIRTHGGGRVASNGPTAHTLLCTGFAPRLGRPSSKWRLWSACGNHICDGRVKLRTWFHIDTGQRRSRKQHPLGRVCPPHSRVARMPVSVS